MQKWSKTFEPMGCQRHPRLLLLRCVCRGGGSGGGFEAGLGFRFDVQCQGPEGQGWLAALHIGQLVPVAVDEEQRQWSGLPVGFPALLWAGRAHVLATQHLIG